MSDADRKEKACEALRAIRSIIPYEAAGISVWDPLTGVHQTLASDGYSERVSSYLNGDFVEEDEMYRSMRTKNPLPLRWQDFPDNYRDLHSARSVFIPAGFDEGMSALLLSGGHRYTGVLHISVGGREDITDEAVGSVTWLQSLLSPIVDELATWSRLVERLSPSSSAMVLDQSGIVQDLPDRRWATSSDNRDALRSSLMLEWATLSSGTHRRMWRSPSGDWLQLRIYGVGTRVLVAVEENSDGPPCSLTYQEMVIVARVAEGKSNKQLASDLGVSVRTVAKHMEHILDKAGAESRTELCSRAHREGFISLPPASG
ncbi:LuxR C-terminal-related transcriptional regulator [Modestobacter lapidis]|nr:response regulator transcription factor [Modestobacter lapidis]